MSPPTYADHAWHGTVAVAENVPLAHDTYRIRFACPEIARRIVPGQFVMLRLADCNDPLLGRPLALYDVVPDAVGRPHSLDVVYLTVGKMTRLLPEFLAGSRLEVWGPLGNGFPPTATEHLVMVAGGIGQTPLLALGPGVPGSARVRRSAPARVPRAEKSRCAMASATASTWPAWKIFATSASAVQLSTDDGSHGHHGLVTDLIRPVVERSAWPCRIVCCGPEAMMAATAEIARELGLPCQVSLESPMACGIGICFSCVKRIRDAGGGWDYRRTCVEGPVFEAGDVQF